ncbi:MAG: response regulator [Deltaproteobacteria bacterium]
MITRDSKNILVADDSLFFRSKLSDILIEAGHKVRYARDGNEVISEIRNGADGIDLLILDLQMSDIDGFGVLKWINDNGFKGRFPVLAVTGVYEISKVMDKTRELGATGLMTKGFTPEQIIFRLNRILFPEKAAAGTSPRTRVPVSIAVDFTMGDSNRTGFLLNISETGAFLHTRDELLVGALIRMIFSIPGSDRVIDVKGIVKWTTSEVASKTLFGGYGIMFTTIDADTQKALAEFVEAEAKRLGLDQDKQG